MLLLARLTLDQIIITMDLIFAALFFVLGFISAACIPYMRLRATKPKAPYILRMPPEILIDIFSNSARHSDARALSKTSRQFRQVWKTHSSVIVDAIQSGEIASYAAARAFAEAVIYVRARTPTSNKMMAVYGDDATQLNRRELIARHAQEVATLTDYWLYNVVGNDLLHPSRGSVLKRNPPYLTAAERARFAYACYRIWTHTVYAALEDEGERLRRQDEVLDVGLSEHWLLCEVVFSFSYHRRDFTKCRFDGLPTEGPTAHNRKEFGRLLALYSRKLKATGHSGMIATHKGCPWGIYMALFDDFQERRRRFFDDIYEGRRTHD